MIENLNAGDEVAVVERDGFGEACDASEYFFINEVLEYFSAQTAEQEEADIYVFPAEDCYKTIQEAKEALNTEIGDDEE